MWLDGVPRPDHGPGYRQHLCATCGAGWVGLDGEGCWWCQAALERQQADERRLLLEARWLHKGTGRYDELSEADRAVWDRTRGQVRGAHSVEAWVARLARAVEAGLVTEAEAVRAIRRMRG